MSAGASSSSANLFRRLVWQSSVPISIRLGDGEPGFGSSCDRYYMRAPRYTYFALLIPEIRENLVELALDDQQLAETEEKDWWLEEETADEADSFLPQGPIRWHWPIDLVHIQSMIVKPHKALSTSISPPALRLILHLSAPPNDKLLMPNSIDACKTQYINQLKEADFVRWRNTNKVTNLRKADLDGGWEGLVSDDYDLFMRMATRLFPLPIHTPSSSIPSRPPSADPGSVGASKPESSYTARALPIKFYLPDGAPVVQEVIPPLLPDGSPQTILGALRQYLPLLFPSTSYTLAIPIIQGVEVPPESELAWLSSCMCGVDGWLRVGIQIRAD